MPIRCQILLLLAATALAGCEQRTQPGPRTAPGTAPAASVAATRPASRPTSSTLAIGGAQYNFPAARLVLQQSEPTLTLLLFSDDPRGALVPGYSGNRYYLQIPLETDDLAMLQANPWIHRAASSERQDTPDGIFLNGDRWQLQPYSVRCDFVRQGSELVLSISGQFLKFDTRQPARAPETIPVQGRLSARIEEPQRAR